MGGLYFFLRSLGLTLVLVLILQIRVGDHTLEQRAMTMVHNSSLVEPLQEVAEGGVTVIRDVWNRITRSFKTDFAKSINSENVPGQRKLISGFERSQRYLEERARAAAEKVQDTVNSDEARQRLRGYGEKLGRQIRGDDTESVANTTDRMSPNPSESR